jgi:hypothetical protein
MNKLTKVGFSALCGSLAAISAANAGDLTVTGGADMTWVSASSDITGNPIGIGSNTTMTGSGELDNGWTFGLTIALLNAQAYSSAAVNLTMGGLGSLNFNQGDSGNGIQAYDDKMPTAWEETWGAGLSTGMRGLVSGVGTSQNIQYKAPTVLGTSLAIAIAPQMGAADIGDKATGVGNNGNNNGYDVTLNINPSFGTEILSGLNIFLGAHGADTHPSSQFNDTVQGVGGFTYSLGPVSIGGQISGEYNGDDVTRSAAIHTYKAAAYGVAFNINDNLSISTGHWESRKAGLNETTSVGGPNDRNVYADSTQIAYTMGGASIRFAEVTVENAFFDSSASADKEAHIVSLGLAF